MRKEWGFYGRSAEIDQISRILKRGHWFFCSISGRRRIGKTALIRQAADHRGGQPVFYVQIPDSDERGIVQTFQDVLEVSGIETEAAGALNNFSTIVAFIEDMVRNGFIIIIDEFQYFHRASVSHFQSMFQAAVDRLRDTDKGGVIVLGSIHTEMSAILEDRNAPLFNRITDRLELAHWDFATLFEMFAAHEISDPYQQLFLWTLFEGVPKFYRDAYNAGVLQPSAAYRRETLRHLFFEGSSPLRDEADNWFLREFRGRYDTVLRMLARLGPCAHGALTEEFKRAGTETEKQLGGYLKTLIEKYKMVEKRLPIFAGAKDRKARYVITDNFLTAWLGALAKNVSQSRFRPLDGPLQNADTALAAIEGFSFEKMVRQLIVECSRKGVGDFMLTEMIQGYWNKPDGSDIEIDLIAVNEEEKVIRFGSCKRAAAKHDSHELASFEGHISRFLNTTDGRPFAGWTRQKALYSPAFPDQQRQELTSAGYVCWDLTDFRNILFSPRSLS